MRTNQQQLDERTQQAIADIETIIRRSYPTAVSTTGWGEDPEGIYVTATVDVDDPDEVVNRYIDRLLEAQVDEGLPLYVVAVRTPARRDALLRRQQDTPQSPLGL